MGSFGGYVLQWVMVIGTAILVFVAALLAPAKLWAKLSKLRWWFVGVALIALGWFFLAFLPKKYPTDRFGDSALPELFRPGYWGWIFLFLLVSMASVFGLVAQLRAAKRARRVEPESGTFLELDAAWAEILVRLDQAKIDLTRQRVYLLIGPDEDQAAALVESAGLQIFAQGPAGPAPIHAYATSDGVLLSCAGASSLGSPDDDGATARLEHLCRKLLAAQPDCPLVRGVSVLLPIDWASRPESTREAAAVRDDLQTIQRILGVGCPVFALFPGMETVPGFLEFAGRLSSQVSPQMLDQRVGFAVPGTHEFSGDLVQRGLAWLSGWFHNWTLNLLAGDPFNQRGNAELVTLDHEFRRYRRRLRSIMESAFSTHKESEPVFFRGCYFMATGHDRQERAFSAGLLRGARSRILADHVEADWTEEADRNDRRYRWIALGIALAGGLISLLTWLFITTRLPMLGWSGLIALMVVWVVAGIRLLRL